MDFGLVKRTDLKSTLLEGIIQVNAGHYELDSFKNVLPTNSQNGQNPSQTLSPER
jgi:hypothetical protein